VKVGRNEPCPCGSGKKHKKCCLARTLPSVLAYSSGDREDALAMLGRFAERQEFEAERDDADREFWSPLDSRPDVDCGHPDLVDDSEGVFEDWFTLDRVGENGLTPVEALLERGGDRLTTGAREYLTRLGRTELRIHEVAAATPDRLDLVDLWTGEARVVRERDADDLEPGDIVAARLMPGADGELVIEGCSLLYPGDVKDGLMEVLKAGYARAIPELPRGGEAVFFKSTAPVLHLLWMLRVAPMGPPACVEAVFDVKDAGRLEAVLDSHPDIETDDDGCYVWMDFGTFTIEDGRLIFHSDSEDLAERGRRMIEHAAGDAVRYAGTRTEEPDVAEDDDEAPPVPPEVEAEVLNRHYDAHYRRWLDEALPALAGLSPRKAAQVPSLRPQVAALLREIEDRLQRAREAGEFAYDARWLRETLAVAPDGRDAAAPVASEVRRRRRRRAPRAAQTGFAWEEPEGGGATGA
jgi:hypothetical protein